MKSLVVKHSVLLTGRKTLKEIAGDRRVTMSELVSGIDKQRQHGNFSSALRLFVLEYYRGKRAEQLSNENGRRAIVS